MIKEIYDALTKSLKDNFRDVKIWASPVVSNYNDKDFVVTIENVMSEPKPNKLMLNKVDFVVETNSTDSNYFIDIMIALEASVDIIELENGILLKGIIKEHSVKNSKLKLKVSYSFYSRENYCNDLMEVFSNV